MLCSVMCSDVHRRGKHGWLRAVIMVSHCMYNCVCICTHVICSQSISLLTLESSVFPTGKWLVEFITPDWRWFPIQVLLKMDKTLYCQHSADSENTTIDENKFMKPLQQPTQSHYVLLYYHDSCFKFTHIAVCGDLCFCQHGWEDKYSIY